MCCFLLLHTRWSWGSDHFLYASDIPHWHREFPKNLKYLWNHPDLSEKTDVKVACDNGKKYF
jgi:hypothetical protein